MPVLDWDVFAECLGVLPDFRYRDDPVNFEVERNGLTLVVSVWPYENTVEFTLRRCGAKDPLTSLQLRVHGQVELRKDRAVEYLQIHKADLLPSGFMYEEYLDSNLIPSIRTYAVVLQVNPDIKIGFER